MTIAPLTQCQCIDEINSWMCQKLSSVKQAETLFGIKDTFLRLMHTLTQSVKQLKIKSEILGWFWRQTLVSVVMSKAVIKLAYYHHKYIARIRCFVSSQDLKKCVHAFITSRWIIVMVSSPAFPRRLLDSWQLIQTLLPGFWLEPENLSISPSPQGPLHWLPVTFRIDLKVLLLVYKSLNGLGPKYIADMLTA